MGAEIERAVEQRLVKWRSSVNSSGIILEPTAGGKLYLPAAFAGATLTIQAKVEIPYQEDTNEVAVDTWVNCGTVASPTAGAWHDLLNNQLFGYKEIRFVSNASESCTGLLTLAR